MEYGKKICRNLEIYKIKKETKITTKLTLDVYSITKHPHITQGSGRKTTNDCVLFPILQSVAFS